MSNNRLGDISKEWIKNKNITELDVYWLIEQVHELRSENRRIRQTRYRNAYEQGKFDTNMKVWYEMPRVEQQNERLIRALRYYADERIYDAQYKLDIMRDTGKYARKTLKEIGR